MTRPNQGLSSLASGVKMRDPGNEVDAYLLCGGGTGGAGARENRGREGYGRRERKGREAGVLRGRAAGEKY